MWYLHWVRRKLIRALVGKMEVCTNMTIVNGYAEYGGRHGGAIVYGNSFLTRRDKQQIQAS